MCEEGCPKCLAEFKVATLIREARQTVPAGPPFTMFADDALDIARGAEHLARESVEHGDDPSPWIAEAHVYRELACTIAQYESELP